MIIDGIWYPDLFPKQFEVFNSTARHLLVSGPSLSGKSIAVENKVVRHLWETPGASVAVFAKTMKNSKDGGGWTDLNNIIIPKWVESRIKTKDGRDRFRYLTETGQKVPGPATGGITRTPFFKIRNWFGGESECMLFSLDHDEDIEDKIKSKRFSMIWFSELSMFHSRKVLSVSASRLRMMHLPEDAHQWIADTNPCEDGEQCWIYQAFYRERVMSYEEHLEECKERGLPPKEREVFDLEKRDMDLIEIMPEENPFLSKDSLNRLKGQYSYDAGLYSRYVLGKWVYGDGDASRHFRAFFRENIHVLGKAESADERQWEYLNPTAGCVELITGWDLGDTNHAAVIIEKVFTDMPGYAARGPNTKMPVYHILQELVSLKADVSIESFTEQFMTLLEGNEESETLGLEEIIGHPVNLERAWSDKSTIERYNAAADTHPYLLVYAASNQRINLTGVPKGRGAVQQRVQLMKKILAQGRIKISANCSFTIQMFKELKKGKGLLNYVVSGDENKHVFDAISYALLMEEQDHILSLPPIGASRDKSLVVQVR